MPMNRARYPRNWEAIARRTKQQANWHCEACGKACLLPGEDVLDFLMRTDFTISEAVTAFSDERGNLRASKETRFVLTTAHPNHDPENLEAELRAWCSPCHCRYDLAQMGRKRMLRREQEGQLSFNFEILVPTTLAGHGKDPTRIQLPIPASLE